MSQAQFKSYPEFGFDITLKDQDTDARLGVLHTPHGSLETPAFIFCGTKANVKSVTPQNLKDHKTQIILSNTYHLMLQPGADLVQKMGGLHKFMGWDGPMLTDSGGYQVFSMGHGSVGEEIKGKRNMERQKSLLKITERGAEFQSYVSGKKILLTPEDSIRIQRKLGADLIVIFDECTAFHDDKKYTENSMQMTHRWAKRCLAEFSKGNDGKQGLYGVVQGGIFPDLRQRGAEFMAEQDFFGLAVGGCLGADKVQMYEVVDYAMRHLKGDPRPIHLLGIGGIKDIWNGVSLGVDTFDCVTPTRIARHNTVYVFKYDSDNKPIGATKLNLKNAIHKDLDQPIDENCDCYCCQNFSRAYLHHLIKAKEILALHLLTLHNICFMNRLLEIIRASIKSGTFSQDKEKWLAETDV